MTTPTPSRGLPPTGGYERAADVVQRELVDSIVSGRFSPDEALPPEGGLTEHFGVSRTIVRESMKRLEEKGLVAIQQGRGTMVQPSSRWNVLDPLVLRAIIAHDSENNTLDELTLVRAALESLMAGQAADLTDPEGLARVEAALHEMEEGAADYDRLRNADADFHRAVMQMSGNFLAHNIAWTLYSHARYFARFEGTPPDDAAETTIRQHRAVLDAIRAGDAERAAEEMERHIVDSWRIRSADRTTAPRRPR